MPVYQGVYKSFLQGVSQQTPQERNDGQLGVQTNMLSDAVTGIRRRGGMKFNSLLTGSTPATTYIKVVDILGVLYISAVDTVTGTLSVYNFDGTIAYSQTDPYFLATGKASIRSTVSRDNVFILNTEKIPTKAVTGSVGKDPKDFGYLSIRSSAFSKSFTVSITHPNIGGTLSFTQTASATIAAQASPEYIAQQFEIQLLADPTISAQFYISRSGTTISLELITKTNPALLDVNSTSGALYIVCSGASRVALKSDLLGTLPIALDGYTMAVGQVGASAYYMYNNSTKLWSEVSKYEPDYAITNTPWYWYINLSGFIQSAQLVISPRKAGDDLNNPMVKFIDYGITGIGAYQSRLVLLSGSYVNLSRTTDFGQFMRTSVTELLADDAIEISSAALSSAQFEYCIPYNKDLVLIAKGQQAVIPANNTVLTPATGVVYPSTKVDLSLACEPAVVARSLYYTYQQGTAFFQVGEFIPNSYTDAQYYNQNLTDHIPLYATGVCTAMASTTTNNMVVMSSDTPDLLVNQFLWQGDQRALMSFHKWVAPYPVIYVQFVQEFLILFMNKGDGTIIVATLDVQLNQLDDKPIPYLDLYQYVTITGGVGTLPSNVPPDFVAVIYDSATARHKEVMYSIVGGTMHCPYNGVIAIGVRYKSEFTLTPPFIKDTNGSVIAGNGSTINNLTPQFKNTGSFDVSIKDTMGQSYTGTADTALTWSEVDLGYTWINSIGSVTIPCRTRLPSTECNISTTSTTDLNLVSTGFTVRMQRKHRRI